MAANRPPLPVRRTEVGGRGVEYCLCRVLPDSVIVVRDVLREAERLWTEHLGAATYAELRRSADGRGFFTAEVRLERVPPMAEMVVVRLPLPPDFAHRLRPQLIDYVEPVP